MIDSPRLTVTRPDAAEYSVAALHLAQVHNRETWEEAHGIQPPPFDPSKPVKCWSITDDTTGLPELFLAVKPGTTELMTLTMPPAEAAAGNIPGSFRYPPYYNPAATPAVTNGFEGILPVNGETLVLAADARALATEITMDTGVMAKVKFVPDGPMFQTIWNGEPRRRIRIEVSGVDHDASNLMRLRHGEGVNRPGRWTVGNAVVAWIAAHPATEPPPGAAEIPVPIAPLLPDEELYQHPFSGVMVRRRSAVTAPISDNAVLAEILDRVKRLCEAMGV